MTRPVHLSERAQRALQGLPESARERLREVLLGFAGSGRGDVKRLHGTKGREDLFRLRVGDYRVVFAISRTEVRVTRIIHRSEGYDWL